MADSRLEAGTPAPCPPSLKTSHSPPPHRNMSMEDMSVCANPGEFVQPKRRSTASTRDKDQDKESIGSALRKMAMKHQLGLSLNFILLLAMTYAMFPLLRSRTKACFSLSYRNESGMYGQGSRDMYLVTSCIIYFTAFRAFMLDYVLLPLANYCGIGSPKGQVRFAEQAYMLFYYLIYWCWGVALFVQDTPSDVKTIEMLLISLWRDFPRLTMTAGMKLYYLTQLAFWIQQVVVIHLEEKRKDHYQMLTHHFVTIGLMVGSYGYRQWRVGNAILVLMDVVDLVLPTAKILRYLSMQAACDAMFGLFVVTWIAARHVGYLAICWSIYAHVNTKTMSYGTYSTITGQRLSADGGTNVIDNLLQPVLNPEAETVLFNSNIRWSFLGLLMALQCITLGWLVMIIGVVIRVLRGQGADDTRSDDEDEEDMEEKTSAPISAQANNEKPRFIEVETSSDEVTWSTRRASNGRKKSKGISSGLNLGEHKEILNRIGCLSEEQLAREREKRGGSASPQPPSSGKR